MKIDMVDPLVADPPQRNSTNRRNPPNRVKLLPYSVTISNLITTLFVQQAVFDYLYNLLLVSKQVPGVKSQHVSPGKKCVLLPSTCQIVQDSMETLRIKNCFFLLQDTFFKETDISPHGSTNVFCIIFI